MGRPKKFFIDADQILLTIFRETIGRKKEIDAQIRELPDDRFRFEAHQRLARERDSCGWMQYRLDAIAGYPLDVAERKRWQRAVLELERTNFVEIAGQRGSAIRLKPKGRRRVRKLLLE